MHFIAKASHGNVALLSPLNSYKTHVYTYIPEVMKTGSGVNLNFLSNFSQLLLSNIGLFTVLFTADVGFFCCCCCCCCCYLALRLGICFQLDVDIIFPPHHPPRSAPMFLVPTDNSFFNTSDTEFFEISARLKLVSVPFRLFLYLAQPSPSLPRSSFAPYPIGVKFYPGYTRLSISSRGISEAALFN